MSSPYIKCPWWTCQVNIQVHSWWTWPCPCMRLGLARRGGFESTALDMSVTGGRANSRRRLFSPTTTSGKPCLPHSKAFRPTAATLLLTSFHYITATSFVAHCCRCVFLFCSPWPQQRQQKIQKNNKVTTAFLQANCAVFLALWIMYVDMLKLIYYCIIILPLI